MSGNKAIGYKKLITKTYWKFESVDHLEKNVYKEIQIDSHVFWYRIGKKSDFQIYETYYHEILWKTVGGIWKAVENSWWLEECPSKLLLNIEVRNKWKFCNILLIAVSRFYHDSCT